MSKKLDRRRFLIGGGSFIALPLFESLWPTKVLAQASSAPNLIMMKFPVGVVYGEWRPSGSGSNWSLPSELSVLQPFKSEILMPTGLHNAHPLAGIHASATAGFLTGHTPQPKANNVKNASVDRMVAARLNLSGSQVMQITAADRSDSDLDYSSTYGTNVSWINANTPASAFNSPRSVFDAVFPNGIGDGGNNQPPPKVDPMARYRKNIFDGVVDDIKSLKPKLNASDNVKLDQYLTGIEEVQRSIAEVEEPEKQEPPVNTSCRDPGDLNLSPNKFDIDAFTDVNLELIKLGLACGQMRIVTYVLDYVYGAHYPTNLHPISHYNDRSQYKDQFRKLQRRWAYKYALLLSKLRSVTDGTGKTLLDNTIVVMGTGINDGHGHGTDHLPIILAGHGGGLQTNRVITTEAPLGNLWVSIARLMGTPVERVGRSNGDLGI